MTLTGDPRRRLREAPLSVPPEIHGMPLQVNHNHRGLETVPLAPKTDLRLVAITT